MKSNNFKTAALELKFLTTSICIPLYSNLASSSTETNWKEALPPFAAKSSAETRALKLCIP